MDKLTFLGTGDSMAVPRVYCRCAVCEEARTTGINRRLRSSVLVEGADAPFMIDCGPSWREQMEWLKLIDLDHLLITHAHYDHVGGLPEYADLCRWLEKKGSVYAPPEVIDRLRTIYPWLESSINYYAVEGTVELWGWSITTWRVCHGHNGYSYAYRFSKPEFVWAYCPDSIALNAEEKQLLTGLDLLVLGTSFYKEEAPVHSRSVYDIVEALQLIEEVRPQRTLFTHLSHGIDSRADYQLPPTCSLAKEGLVVKLGAGK